MSSERFQVVAVNDVQVMELLLPEVIDSDEFDRINDSIITLLSHKPGGKWVMDLTAVSYMGSSALGLLVNVRQTIKQAGGRLVICGLSHRLLEIFHTCCMERLFAIVRNRDEAIEHLSK